jgi:hypothetical protein
MKKIALIALISSPFFAYSQQVVKERLEVNPSNRVIPEAAPGSATSPSVSSTTPVNTNEAIVTNQGSSSFSFNLIREESAENARNVESRILNERKDVKSVSISGSTCRIVLKENMSEIQQQQAINYVVSQLGYKSAKIK